MKIYKESLKRNKCQLILANGSERGEFVPLDYVFSQFKGIHDGVQLMRTYYPEDDSWNPYKRISTVSKKERVSFAWDYEYEDYHPFDVFENKSATLDQMELIKLYGSDIYLTLT